VNLVAKEGYSRCENEKKGIKIKMMIQILFQKSFVPFTISMSADAYNKLCYVPDIPRCRSTQISNK